MIFPAWIVSIGACAGCTLLSALFRFGQRCGYSLTKIGLVQSQKGGNGIQRIFCTPFS